MAGTKFTDPVYDSIEQAMERKYNLPAGGMRAIRTLGERSNEDQVSSKGARTVYQIIPQTRKDFLKAYGVDAYASKEAAAEVAALHLRDSLRRNRGDWRAAVAEYNGGTNKANHNNAETRAYVERVTGRKLTVPAGPNGATQLAPGIDISELEYDELKNVAPDDLGSDRAIGPIQKAKLPSKSELVTKKLIGDRNLVAPRASDAPDISVDQSAERAAVAAETERAGTTFTDRLGAAIDKNWVLNQVVRGIERESFDEDPEWSKQYLENVDEYRTFAETPQERKRLDQTTSRQDYLRVVEEIKAERARDKVINSNGTGLAFELGSSLIDPVGLAVGLGLGKVAQMGKSGYTVGRAALENSAANLAFTGALDYSGVDQDASDYAISGLSGLALGAAMYPLTKPSGQIDKSLREAVDGLEGASAAEAKEIIDEAVKRAGPTATPNQLKAKVAEVQQEKLKDTIIANTADVGDESKFLPVDKKALLTGTKKTRNAEIEKNNLDAIDDEGEQALVAEMTARADAMVDANPIDEAGLQGRLLRSVGQESTGLTLLRSKSNVLKAVAMQLLEGTTGAGGRRRTAAMAQVMHERLYMRHIVKYDHLFDMWRRSEGIGKLEAIFGREARDRFDRDVFFEVEARQGRAAGSRVTDNAAVAEAADAWEAGMAFMAKSQRDAGTLGSLRIPENSTGYMRHVIDNRKMLGLSPAQRKAVEDVFAKQFRTLNEYTYVDEKTGATITKKFDKEFSQKLAKKYIVEAQRRGNGSYDIPANIHSPEGAEIVKDALAGLRGLDTIDREALLGKFSRGGAGFTKGRLKLDLRADIGDGKVLGDLFRQDIVGLYRGYARRASGEVALANYGIYGRKGLDLLREAAARTGATADELKAFDQIAAEFLNQPYQGAVRHAFMDNVRIATSAARLGGMGFTQIAETANGLAALGVSRVLSSIGGMNRLRKEIQTIAKGGTVDNPVLNSIDTLGGHLGIDGYQLTRLFDLPDNEVQMYNDNTVGLMGRFLRGGSHMVAVASGHRIISAVQQRGMAEQIVRKAVGYIRAGKQDKALLDMGFTPEIQKAIKDNMDKIATFDSKGNLQSLDLMAGDIDPNTMMAFRDSVERGAGQIIQRTFIGETGAWAHNDFLKLLLQFRTFSVTSIEKQWGRNQRNYGAMQSAALLFGAMSFALPIHFARLQLQMVGKSDKEKREMMDERMSAVALGRATLNYASAAGMLGDLMDVTVTVGNNIGLVDDDLADDFTGGGQGRQSVSGIVPGAGLVDDVLKGTVGGQPKKLLKLAPGSNLPFVTPMVNGLTSD